MKKKTITALLTLLSTVSLTACSMNFSANTAQQAANNYVETIQIDIAKELADTLDGIDFKSEESIAVGVGEVTDWANAYAKNSEYLSQFQSATLVRVVDGDTIVVDIEGTDYKVRLIGIDTPESVASAEYLDKAGKENTEEGIAASEFTKSILANSEVLYLQPDVSDTDKYGRLLRYVWLEIPDSDTDIEEIKIKMLNGILVYEGYANAVTYKPDVAHKADFEYLEDLYEYGMELD